MELLSKSCERAQSENLCSLNRALLFNCPRAPWRRRVAASYLSPGSSGWVFSAGVLDLMFLFEDRLLSFKKKFENNPFR